MNNKNTIIISVGIMFKESGSKKKWLLVKKNGGEEWELPRITVRKTESSARAAIRMAGEQLATNAQILEEVGRSGGVTTVNGRALSQRQLYYLMKSKSQAEEALAFVESEYMEYVKAYRKLTSKRDKQMLKAARDEFKKWLNKKERVVLN